MYLSRQFLIVVTSTFLIFIGYFSTCSCSANEHVKRQTSELKILPDSSNSSGNGGLDLDLYDKVVGIVNVTRGLPSFVAQFGDFTLLQFAIMVVVGGLLVGAAALLAEAHFFRLYYSDLFDHAAHSLHGAPPIYGAPEPPKEYGAPSPPSTYGAPSPPSTYVAPSPPSTYGAPSPPSTYGAPSPPTPSPPNEYGAPNPPSEYGAPSPSSVYGG